MKVKPFLALCSVGAAILTGNGAQAQDKFIKEGIWRGVFTVNEVQVPFNFEVKGQKASEASFALLNGTRRDYFVVKQTTPDSLFIKMNTYDAALVAKIEDDGTLTGAYKSLVPGLRGNSLPFVAEHGKSYRFVEPGKDQEPAANLSGKWKLNIISKDATPGRLALLEQKGNKLTGVIMSVVGDTRELEGTVQGKNFVLSGFTGPSPIIVRGTINDDKSLSGEMGFGIYLNQKFEGVKDRKADLPDPYALTHLKEGVSTFDFSLPDLNGNPVSLSDAKYKGKVVIIEIIGTWCPNCTDQTAFLSPWFRENKNRGVEAIAVGFEQKDDLEYARYTLGKLRDKYKIEYDILFGGIADKKVASGKFPSLNRMMAFPTTIIIGRDGTVRQIHTGYTGEVTGKYFKQYVKKWNRDLDKYIAEPAPKDALAAR
ncbi:peroxiredoxin family protein [Larkinella humicola]|uniref:TlpA family protein disulfide reductase n=1 Tax=Larkinella humicola TaxID=2607654 RepID=A0A5N1JA97_9BACT|nr:TlpA disulfide reductase family protein [Larkinella humicola]KAA9349597.1 TlpA family protein disulfide reductase [Larkinella humicola]